MDYSLTTLEIFSHGNRSGNDGVLPISCPGGYFTGSVIGIPVGNEGRIRYRVWSQESSGTTRETGSGTGFGILLPEFAGNQLEPISFCRTCFTWVSKKSHKKQT